MKRTGLILATVAALTFIGCTNMTPREQGTVSGAAIGAAAGAGIDAIAGGPARPSAAFLAERLAISRANSSRRGY